MTKSEMLEELKKGKRMTRKVWKSTGYYLQSLSDNPDNGTIDIKFSLHLALNNGGGEKSNSIKETIYDSRYWDADDWEEIANSEFRNNQPLVNRMDKDFFGLFDERIEYPSNLAELGVPQDTLLSYVSNTFLNGIVNYVDIKHVIMIERYTEFDADKIDGFIEWLNNEPNTKYDNIQKTIADVEDDIILFGETDNSFWIFWSDRDCSDCTIGRISASKLVDVTEFKDMFVNWLESYKEYYSGNYVELPNPKGWITL